MTGVPIDWVQVQDLPWTGAADGSAADRAGRTKLLRSDPSGATTAVVDCPPGFQRPGQPGTLTSFVVLGGAIEVAGQVHGHLGFGQVWGDSSAAWSAPAGARLLTFQQPAGDSGGRLRLADPVDTLEVEWALATDPSSGSSWRELELTPAGNPAGAIGLRSLAVGDAPVATHRHDWDEEVFILDGERLGPAGAMTAGGYAWRPRGTWHGGFRTGSPGALVLVRRVAEPAALASLPEQRFSPVAPVRVQRPARLAPAAAANAELMAERQTLTGRID
ncbi:MAG: hypothetical protein GEV12_18530 [Micromonosporaceae bacterium]|nr:hypothetical protein [Micromonosporaceae bacterium]